MFTKGSNCYYRLWILGVFCVIFSLKEIKANAANVDGNTVPVPDGMMRAVMIGDLPASFDQSLLLRKGRRIPVHFLHNFNSDTSHHFPIACIAENIYDDTGTVLLLPRKARIPSYFTVQKNNDKIIIAIMALKMSLDIVHGDHVVFSNPPVMRTASEEKKAFLKLFSGTSQEVAHIRETEAREQEEAISSPVLRGVLDLSVESEDRLSYRKIIFNTNLSGELTVNIDGRYIFNLFVEKDILFSGSYLGW